MATTQNFNCPNCGAPLDYKGGDDKTIRCPFCNNSVIVPEELRAPSATPLVEMGALGNLGNLVGEAAQLKEIAELARSGNKIQAIKLYRELTNADLVTAKNTVEAIAEHKPFMLSDTMIDASSIAAQATVSQPTQASSKGGGIGCSLLIAGFVIFVVLVSTIALWGPPAAKMIGLEPAATSTRTATPTRSSTSTRTPTPTATPAFANRSLVFGSQGIGAGQFQDARNVAVDGEGNVYVAEYSGGRVQAFDSTGKFLNQWMVDAKSTVQGLVADRKGVVSISLDGVIMRYDGATGKPLGNWDYANGNLFGALAHAPDGSLWATWYEGRWGIITSLKGHRDDLVHFDANGKVTQVIQGIISGQTGSLALDNFLAVDGLGNVYILSGGAIYRFSPEGKFVNKFGSVGSGRGQFQSPQSIAVDNQGRVYVGDSRQVLVFGGDGHFIESFPTAEFVSSLAFDNQNNLWIVARQTVAKYTLLNPSGK